MFRLIALIALFTALTDSPLAAGTFFSGNKLLDNCKKSEVFCNGFVAGISDMQDTLVGLDISQQSFCIPSNATLGQLRMVLMKHFENNPQDLHFSAASITRLAFINAFPCKK